MPLLSASLICQGNNPRRERSESCRARPSVATGVGASELRIYVTRLNEQPLPSSWHVSVNNPTETMMTAAVRQNMALPGLALATTTVALEPGEMRVLL